MTLLADTYVVLDVPEPFATRIIEARLRIGDAFRASLPAEISLVGSAAMGPIAPSQPLPRLLEEVERIAAETQPFASTFGPVTRFPASDVFYLPPEPSEPIIRLHEKLRDANFSCQGSHFPFVPHCTLSSLSPVTEALQALLAEVHVPGSFTIASMSIYTTDRLPALSLVARFPLRSRAV